jgi:hypothetical protein
VIDRATARELASRDLPGGLEVDDTHAREIQSGWFFPYRPADSARVPLGTHGVIVNKETGATFGLGSAFPIERDLALYDKGYQFHHYDLVVTRIADIERTLDTLQGLEISTVEPTYEHGTVWRIPRPLSREELRSRVANLPHVFGGLQLYFRAEVLEEARRSRFFQFELLGCG